jgi:hypothetical protein
MREGNGGMQELEAQKVRELIVSQVVPGVPLVASMDEFIQHVYPDDAPKNGETGLPLGLILGVEKIRRPGDRHYRLIWIGRRKAALAAENAAEFRRKIDAIAAGHELAAETGIYFDEQTR